MVVGDELLMDRFRVLERIGSGGMGVVYRAFDERLQRDVAVKEVASADPARVLREAQAAARLNHHGIATLYELGERDGHAVLVSELVPGRTLASLHADGRLSDRRVAEVGAAICDALAHAHSRGVVHRDVKPDNVIVGERDGVREAKLMDFGIARIAGAPTLTERGQVIGTLAYMSPEQAAGELAGPASDAYSLALTLYQCWSGTNPVAAATPAETVRRIGEPLPSLRAVRPGLSVDLADTIDACLEPDPRLRPAVADLGECLEAEAGALDSEHLLPAPPADHGTGAIPSSRGSLRLLGIAGLAIAMALIAGPGAAPGAALVLLVLLLPSLLVGLPLCSLWPLAAPVLTAAGIPGASSALGAAGRSLPGRAVLGAASWAWLAAGSLALALAPDLGLGPPAPDGWSADPALAAETVLAPLVTPESLLCAATFAVASIALGWVLKLRHASIALLAAMLWAAGTDAALSLVGNGALGGRPVGIVLAAAAAVALEFGLLRTGAQLWHASRSRGGSRPLTT